MPVGVKGADTRISWRFYVVVVQSLLIFVLEFWVATPHILRALGRLNSWVAWHIYGQIP